MSVLSIILIIIIGLIAYAFRDELMAIAAFVGIFMGIGALLFWILFDNAGLGAKVGFWFSLFIGLRFVLQGLGLRYSNFFEYTYRFISFPIWFLNRLQHILMEPWRYWTKDYIYYSTREAWQPWIYPIEIVLYILLTPLRLINAIIYNIFVYSITELYDLILEVFFPGSYNEGKGDVIGWILWFPVRLIKYPIFHGSLVVIEAITWTIIDIFIPTVTMYHGTDLTAAQAIVCNDWNKAYSRKWTDGTFSASRNGWAGAGVYFGSSRRTAKGYAYDCYRLSDNNPVMIVCRVSLGKVLNYRLAPSYVHDNTGSDGNHAEINNYAQKNGYTTGEWWNYKHDYWEYCMFDWKNRYNHPWRIRPIYVFNFRTGLAQHIDGGFRHWLFSKSVLNDILNSWRFTALATISLFIALWLISQAITRNIDKFDFSSIMGLFEKTKADNTGSRVLEEWEEDYAIAEQDFVDEVEDEVKKEPVKPKQAMPTTTKTPRTQKQYRQPAQSSRRTQSAPTAPSRPKGKGFRLEKVDRIPRPEDYGIKNGGVRSEDFNNHEP